jgi:anaerobic selenocysteine-containing dehydrogenase
VTTAASFCRICQAMCGVVVEIEDGRAVSVKGDDDNLLSRGFTCPKGRKLGTMHHDPGRLLTSLARGADGELHPIAVETALDEIAERLDAIRSEHGADAIAMFLGTQNNYTALTGPLARAWFTALGSPKLFSTMTIDQSAKWIVPLRMGQYLGGAQSFRESDVWLLSGNNPLVSMQGGTLYCEFPTNDPVRRWREAKARGLQLIVIDPRRTEIARYADIHLQPLPGRDAVLYAGLLHVLFADGLIDQEFCDRFVADLDALRAAVAPVTPEFVAARAGVPAEQLVAAARMFGRGSRGMATGSTGPDMGPHSNLAQHLLDALNVVCGRYLREGETVPCPSVISPRPPARAQVEPPRRSWEDGFRSRIGGFGQLQGELPSAILPDEILEPGDDRVRALVVSGGNPASAIPDPVKTVRALRELDLLVAIDPRRSETAMLADYVIAPALAFERPDHTSFWEMLFSESFAQYTPALLPKPEGVIEDWEVFWGLAVRMGLPLNVMGTELEVDASHKPTSEELLDVLAAYGQVPLDEVRKHPHGARFDPPRAVVKPAKPGAAEHRLELLADDVAAELRDALTEPPGLRGDATHLLIVRRMRETMNSLGRDVPALTRRAYNPLWMHPEDLADLGLADGDVVQVENEHGQVDAIVATDESVRRGVVAMTHAWGRLPGEVHRADDGGANPGILISADEQVEAINRMPRMTGVPVRIRPATTAASGFRR